jgi:uncharacterized NAD(P)/FAD-binding protein YdhS
MESIATGLDIEVKPPRGPLRLVICGGGASAVLLLSALRQRVASGIDVTVIEPRDEVGLGVAYSTNCPLHLLNTRARNMSATEDPDDFFHWLRKEHRRRPLNWTRNCFAPRALYGQYLRARLFEIRSAANVRFRWLRSTADSIVPHESGWKVVPGKGDPVPADVVILATGNEPPRAIGSGLEPAARAFVIDDPWGPAAKENLAADQSVLLVGTGLTAVDVAIELLHGGHTGSIYAVSRRGLLPRRHGPVLGSVDGCGSTLPGSLRALVRHVRSTIENDPRGSTWQSFVNEMRSMAPALWAGWDTSERRRFLRHVRPFWDVHRHRIAPQVHTRIARAIDRGQLKVVRARLGAIECLGGNEGVCVQFRGRTGERVVEVARVINCTGPEIDPRRAENPLLGSLLSDGLARPDPLGLGLAVDSHSRIIGSNGAIHPGLFALGPLTRGSRWEVTAIAEIRDQASSVARKIARDLATSTDCGLRLAPVGSFRQSAA